MTEIHLQHLIQVVICMDKVLINKIVQNNQMRQNITTEMNLKIILVMIYMIMDQTKNGKSRQGLNTEHYIRDEFVHQHW